VVVSLPDGSSVTVPPGAVTQTTTVSLEKTGTQPPGAYSPIYNVGPAGTQFAQPVTISLPIPAGTSVSGGATIYMSTSQSGSYEALPTTVAADGSTATAQVDQAAPVFVGQPCSEGASCAPETACRAGAQTCVTGKPTCSETGLNLADGASCGGGQVCGLGTCIAPSATGRVTVAGGGTVTLQGGVTVTFPPGALSADTQVTVQVVAGASPPGALSPVLEFLPPMTFAQPVTVSFPVSGTPPPGTSIYWTQPGSTTAWDPHAANLSVAGVASTDVTHFSRGFVAAGCSPGAACAVSNPCHVGAVVCTSGAPVCTDTGVSQPDGTACGGTNVCTSGACGAAAPLCANMAGTWTIMSHCSPAYVGKSIDISQTGCTATSADPVNGSPATLQVSSSTVTMAPSCSGTVSGSTLNWTCGTCAQTLVRQAPGASLVGTWTVSGVSGSLVFNANGTYAATSPSISVTGTYQVAGSQLSVVDVGGTSPCPSSQAGLYAYAVSGTALTISLVSDACLGRSLGLPGTYTRAASVTCVSGQACTPTGTPDPCKTYATACDASGAQTCGVAGNRADYTSCGSGNTCTAGACSPLSCSPITNTFSAVPETRVATYSPTPPGGTIVDGVYDLTGRVIYTGPGGLTGTITSSYAGTAVFSGGVFQEAIAHPASAPSAHVVVATYSLSGNIYTITSSICGSAEVGYTLGYAATANEFRTLPPGGGLTGTSMVYTRRGTSTCVAGQACTPTGTASPCQTYATACDANGSQICAGSSKADGTSCGGVNYCAAGVCSRTVSGAFETTYWPDSGVKTTVGAQPSNGEVVTAVLVPNSSATGYATIPATQNPDGTFTASNVPAGTYYLQTETPNYPFIGDVQVLRPIVTLYPFTTSAPRFTTVTAARPDVAYPTQPTMVTLNLSNMEPWTTLGQWSEILMSSSQADVSTAPLGNVAKPAAGATSFSAVFDWSTAPSMANRVANGLPDPAKGDVLFVCQRPNNSIGSGASTATLVIPTRCARLDAYPGVVDGASSTIDAPLVAVPNVYLTADMRPSAFDALLSSMAPGGMPDPSIGVGFSIFSSPHTVLGPDEPDVVARNGYLGMSPGAPDTNYGDVPVADFLDPLWQKVRQVYYTGLAPVAAPGATPTNLVPAMFFWDAVSSALAGPVVPLLGPVASPLVDGRDATADIATPVGLQPIISWSAPALGSANLFVVTINELVNDAGATVVVPVVSAIVRGALSFKLPPGVLKGGRTYVANISALDEPWNVLDGNPLGWGAPTHQCDRYTGTFTP
jgi:hypothetical protein